MMGGNTRREWYLLLLFLLAATVGYAQTSTQQEVTVFLKDGKVIKGITTLSMFEGYLTLEADEFNQTHIAYADIRQIVFGPVGDIKRVPGRSPKQRKPFAIQERGFFHVIEIASLRQSGGYYGPYPGGRNGKSISTIHGYTFNPYLMVGLGVSLDHYGYGNITAAPLFASVRGLMLQRRWSPMYFLNVGGGGAWGGTDYFFNGTSSRTSGGLMIHPGLGYRWHIRQSAVLFSMGYKVQRARLSYSWEDWDGSTTEVNERRTLRRLSLSVGFQF